MTQRVEPPEILVNMQNSLQQALIYQGEAPHEAARSVKANKLTAEQHIGIYQRSYYLRLLQCMREQFPALCYALGEALFNDFSRDYLLNYPSNTYTLYELGSRFPAYLADTRPDKDKALQQQEVWVNFMIDLARFERELFVLFDAPGTEQTGYADDNTPDENLALQTCMVLGHYQFAVADYYHAVRNGDKPALPAMKPTRLALVRKDYLTRTVELSEAQFLFLQAMKNGFSVNHALLCVADTLGVSFQQLQDSWISEEGVRKQWFAAGLFIDTTAKAKYRFVQ